MSIGRGAGVGSPEIMFFGVDFRGSDLFADPTVLATGLTEADFFYSGTTFRFLENGVSQLMVERALDTVTFSRAPQSVAIPAPGAAFLLLFGMTGFATAALLRRT
jgi:hypothetical protein